MKIATLNKGKETKYFNGYPLIEEEDNLINEYRVTYPCAIKRFDVENNYLNKLAIKELICQFKYLSAFEKDVMYLMCEQYKPREIAQLMHVKEKVIYNAIQRCKNKIKRYFKMI